MRPAFPVGSVAQITASLREHCYATAYDALENDDFENALRFFGLLAALAPHDERAWIGLAVIRERRGDLRAAAGLYRVGAAIGREQARSFFGLGRTCKRLRRHGQSERAFDAAEAATEDRALLAAIVEERTSS